MRVLLALFVLLGAGVVAMVLYGIFADSRAADAAMAFCDRIEIGSPLARAEAQAEGVGEARLHLEYAEFFTVGFTGMPPFSRHLCQVSHNGQVVTAVEYRHAD